VVYGFEWTFPRSERRNCGCSGRQNVGWWSSKLLL